MRLRPPTGKRLPPAAWIGLAGSLLAAAVGVIGLLAPPTFWARPGWHDPGLRLLSDETEVAVFFDRGRWFAEGGIPFTAAYRQEYPPLGVLFLTAPRLLTGDFRVYEAVFVLVMAGLFGLMAGLTAALLGRLGRRRILTAMLLLPPVLYFSLWRFDLLPALLVTAALYAAVRERLSWAFVLMTVSVLVKFYAVLFLLPLVMFAAGRVWTPAEVRRIRNGALLALAVAAAVVAVLAVAAGIRSAVYPILFHLSRPLEFGSLPRVIWDAFSRLGLGFPTVWRTEALLFLILQFGFTVPLVIWGRVRDGRSLVRACVFVLIPFMMFGRFYSPQWLIWLLPLQLPVAGRRELWLLAALSVVTYIQFPVVYGVDPAGGAYAWLTLLRTLLLFLLWFADIEALTASGALKLPFRSPAAPVPA